MVLFFIVIDIVFEISRTNLHILIIIVGLGQVASHQTFSRVRVNIHKVSCHQVAIAYHYCQSKHAHVVGSGLEDDNRHQDRQSYHEYLSSDSVQSQTGIIR